MRGRQRGVGPQQARAQAAQGPGSGAQAEGPDRPGAARARKGTGRGIAEQGRRQDHGVLGLQQFVYIHIIWFGCWIGFGVEKYPFGLLTMIVSLEAIFLSTFVMISQNRADAKRQVIADEQSRPRAAVEAVVGGVFSTPATFLHVPGVECCGRPAS
jgi:hypothetical protein